MGEGQGRPLLPAAEGRRAATSGTSARRPGTTSSTARGSSGRSQPGIPTQHGAMPARGRARPEVVANASTRCCDAARPHGRAARRRHLPPAGALRAAGARPRGRRRPGAPAHRPQGQDDGGDQAPHARLHDGRRRLRARSTSSCGRACARTTASRRSTTSSTRWAPSSSRASTPSRASAAARTRTTSPTACCAPAIPSTSTSSRATRATARATTGRSPSAARRARSSTPTSAAGTTSTSRSTPCGPGVTTADIARLWPKAEEFGFPNEEAAFALQYGHGVGLAVWEKPLISRSSRSTIPSRSRRAW